MIEATAAVLHEPSLSAHSKCERVCDLAAERVAKPKQMPTRVGAVVGDCITKHLVGN